MKKILIVILFFLLSLAPSRTHKLSFVNGLPELWDIKYELEISKIGLAVKPGLIPFIIAPIFFFEDDRPFNPMVYASYNQLLFFWLVLKPEIGAGYFYGYHTSHGDGKESAHLDLLFVYPKLNVEFLIWKFFLNLNAGIISGFQKAFGRGSIPSDWPREWKTVNHPGGGIGLGFRW